MKKTFVLLSAIRKRAKQLRKEKFLKWNHALDESAKELGFSNFKNYKNTSEANIKEYKSSLDILFKNMSLENDISKKMEEAISFVQNQNPPFKDILDILKLFHDSHELGEHPDFEWIDDVHFVCVKLNLMTDEIQSYLLSEFFAEEGENNIHDFYLCNYTAKKISISNMTYEIREDTIYADGHYRLTIEGESYEPPHNLEERELEGSFGVNIDRNKKMILEHSDISDSTGDYSRRSPFTVDEEKMHFTDGDESNQFDDILTPDKGSYGEIKRRLSNNEPLTGKTLELALGLVDAHGDDEFSKFTRNIGVKLKAGKPLENYEHHILVDVLMLHAQLGA